MIIPVGVPTRIPLVFEDADGVGKDPGTVYVDITDPSGNLTSGASSGVGPQDGERYYTLTADEGGTWLITGKSTASGLKAKHVRCAVIVLDAVTQARLALLDNLDAAVSGCSTHSAADVAALVPDAAANASAVWGAGSRTLTSFGTLVADVWSYGTRTLTSLGGAASEIAAAVWAYTTRTLTSLSGLITSDDSVLSPVTSGSVTVYQGCDYSKVNGTELEIPVTGDVSGDTITIVIKGALDDEEDLTITDAEGGNEIVTLELTAAETAAMVPTNTSRFPVTRKLLIFAKDGDGKTSPVKEGTWIVKEGA